MKPESVLLCYNENARSQSFSLSSQGFKGATPQDSFHLFIN